MDGVFSLYVLVGLALNLWGGRGQYNLVDQMALGMRRDYRIPVWVGWLTLWVLMIGTWPLLVWYCWRNWRASNHD